MRKRSFVLSLAALPMLAGTLHAQVELPSRYIEELTWTEIRDALAAGYTTAVIPTGGTEQNAPHMVMGKHNYVITYAAGIIADRLGNALVAPTIQYVPEGDFNSPTFQAGVLSAPASFQPLMEAAARSLKVHGFKDILIVGDNGGNQNGIRAVTEKLNAEWAGSGTTVYGLTDYYDRGQDYTRVWLQALYGYDMGTIGTHAGITDTSAMMFVFPDGIRRDKIALGNEGQSGDPTKAEVDIGRMVVNFKVLATLAQYQALKSPPVARGRGGRGPGGD